MRNIVLISTAVGMVIAIFVVIAFKSSISSRLGSTSQANITNQSADYPPKTKDLADKVIAQDNSKKSESFFLTISEPVTNTKVSSVHIVIKGKTVPDAEVFVNDKSLIADKKGEFEVPLVLDEGDNEINIMANNSDGDFMEKDLIIIYEPL